MTAVTIRTNGQTLSVNASISYWTSAALAVTASSSNDVESTTWTTITSDSTLYFANANDTTWATVTIKQLDGTTLGTHLLNVQTGAGPYTLNPVPNGYQAAGDLRQGFFDLSQPKDRESTMPRWMATGAVTHATGVCRFIEFTAAKTRSIGSFRTLTSASGGYTGGTPTICRIGVWTIAADGALDALIGSTTNDTAMWATNATAYTKAATAAFTVTQGVRYMVGTECVTAGTGPSLLGVANPNGVLMTDTDPRLTGTATGQTDLPGTLADASIVAGAAGAYVELIDA